MRLRRCTLAALILAFVFAAGGGVPAQENPVAWSAKVAAKAIRAGAGFDVTITGVAEEEWHVYSVTQGPGGPVPTTIAVAPPFSRDGAIRGTEPVTAYDPNFEIQTETYDGTFTLMVPLRLAADAPGNERDAAPRGRVPGLHQAPVPAAADRDAGGADQMGDGGCGGGTGEAGGGRSGQASGRYRADAAACHRPPLALRRPAACGFEPSTSAPPPPDRRSPELRSPTPGPPTSCRLSAPVPTPGPPSCGSRSRWGRCRC